MATYGVGGPTADAEKFYNWLTDEKNNGDMLKGVKYLILCFLQKRYTVFALGNSSYETFCGMGVTVDARLEKMGASRIYPLGKVTNLRYES